jgi:hypothetical protein
MKFTMIATVLIGFCVGFNGGGDAQQIDCAEYAQEIGAEADDARMHTAGCDDPLGEWVPNEGKCALTARVLTARGFNEEGVVEGVERIGCIHFEDGSYGTS